MLSSIKSFLNNKATRIMISKAISYKFLVVVRAQMNAYKVKRAHDQGCLNKRISMAFTSKYIFSFYMNQAK
jgi:hypothetical protein